MRKILLLLSLAAILISSHNFAQDNLEQLEKDIAQIKSEVGKAQNQISANSQKLNQQLAHIQKQDEKIASYERALKLLKTKHETKLNHVVFNITEVIGSQVDGTLTFKGVLVNEGGGTVKLSSTQSEYFDNEAKQIKGMNNVKIDTGNMIEALSNVPVKFEVVFTNIPQVKAAKVTALNLKVSENHRPGNNVIFKNMIIEWKD